MSELNTPLIENEHIKELMSTLTENGKDTSSLAALLGYVSAMENQLSTAVSELQSMIRELNSMKNERNHPLRAVTLNTVKSLELRINQTKEKLNSIKEMIIKGCKDAVAEFKQKGVSALNNIASFFGIKYALESLKNNIQNDIKEVDNSIAKIETISSEYHAAGRHLKNIGRAIRGKETIADINPNGKLAKLIEAPLRVEKKCMESVLKSVEKSIISVERLEKTAPQKESEVKKPSVIDNMKNLKAKIEQEKKESPGLEKPKQRSEAAL